MNFVHQRTRRRKSMRRCQGRQGQISIAVSEEDLQKEVEETLGNDAMISFEEFRSMFGGTSAAGRCCWTLEEVSLQFIGRFTTMFHHVKQRF